MTVPRTLRTARGRTEEVRAVEREDLPRLAAGLAGDGARLLTMVGADERAWAGTFAVYWVWLDGAGPGVLTCWRVAVPADDPWFPSVTPACPAAHWFEREVQDLLGLEARGHPDPRRLVLHENWPEGVHPLRKDVSRTLVPARAEVDTPFQRVEGEGVMEIPVGPIHAGIIEPGHFRFSAVGETVINLEARLFYTHRGLEKEAEGLDPHRGLLLAERICGQCSFSHAVAYAGAVEALAGTEVPRRARLIRTLGLELERLANHLGDVGNVCAGTGFAFGAMLGARLREEVMRLNEALAGNRFLRGLCLLGGVRRDLAPGLGERMERVLARVEADFRELRERLLAVPSFLDRVQGTGLLARRVVEDLGGVGVAARAAGVAGDLRRDLPYEAYPLLAFDPVLRQEGDVYGRLLVRLDEVGASIGLVRQCLERLREEPPGELLAPLGDLPARTPGLGWTESPRGGNVHWVVFDADGRIERHRVRSASYMNWPLVPFAVQGNIVPDFPLINKSFELCYACLDR